MSAGKRGGPRELTAIYKARLLAAYTIDICTNEKNFPLEYETALTNDIIQTAKDIYLYARRANRIKVESNDTRTERRLLQEMAIRRCGDLCDLIELAQPVYHLETRRIKYWEDQTDYVQNLLERWMNSDIRRYGM
ncbi:MAG: hypothetical protein LIO96_11155 [Lachnospiraceae bacterium]|nr:hypothetical protein [Lachnospiraceae bacterium]